jgi:alpha-galactosidase
VLESEIKQNADYISVNLKQFGWEYVVVDYLWSYDNPPKCTVANINQFRLKDGAYVPWLAMDSYGRLLPNVNKFPSAFPNKGFKPLSDYMHSKGMKFGIHVMRGIPRQAVWAKTPILNAAGITANMIADTTSTCSWVNHMYGLNMKKPGAQEYLNSLLKLYASWGVDFIKVDDLSSPYSAAEIEGYQKAIQQCSRPIVLSVSPGATPVNKADHVKQFANQWRIRNDFWDNWKEILEMFNIAKNWEGMGAEGHWPDCDMLQIGKLSKRGPVGKERYSRFTDDELFTHFSFWAIFRSPLMIGGNLPENREIEKQLFTNKEVIAVNQQGRNPRQLYKNEDSMVWVSEIADSKDRYVGLFNIADAAHEVSLDLSTIGFNDQAKLRDLWKKKELGIFKNQYTATIPAHGCLLLRVGAISN